MTITNTETGWEFHGKIAKAIPTKDGHIAVSMHDEERGMTIILKLNLLQALELAHGVPITGCASVLVLGDDK